MYQEIYCAETENFIRILDTLMKRDFAQILFLSGHPSIMAHTQFRLLTVLSGINRIRVYIPPEIREVTVTSDTMLISLPNGSSEWIEYDPEGTEILSLVFWPAYLRLLLLDVRRHPTCFNNYWHHATQNGRAPALLLQAMSEFAQSPERNKETLNLLLRSLFCVCLSGLRAPDLSLSGKAFDTYSRIKQLMFARMEQKIDRNLIAAMTGITPAHLSKLFRRYEQDTFNSSLLKIRMERAVSLLGSSDAALKEIAEKCGYSDLGYFISSFRKFYGSTPGRYRTRFGNNTCLESS